MNAKLWTAPKDQHYVLPDPLKAPQLAAGAAPGLLVVTWHEGRRQIGSAIGALREAGTIEVGHLLLRPSGLPHLLSATRAFLKLVPGVRAFSGVHVRQRGSKRVRFAIRATEGHERPN